MRLRTATTTALVAVVAASALAPALAAPAPKPIKETYAATATPDPTTTTPGGVREPCQPVTPTAMHSKPFKVPAAGTLKITIAMTGDWALGLRTSTGSTLATSDGPDVESAESIVQKFKKATEVRIDACNFAGAPTAQVTYEFTFATKK